MTREAYDFADPCRRRLKLFLSADIIGSTAYKQPFDINNSPPEEASKWSPVVNIFYSAWPSTFLNMWDAEYPGLDASRFDRKGQLNQQRPRFWKTVGDEVIFWQELSHEQDIWVTLAVWLSALHEMRAKLRERTSLDIKSSAWVSEFPVRNKAVPMQLDVSLSRSGQRSIKPRLPVEMVREFYREAPGAAPVDFIGPGIDVGFRLSSFASAKRMAISLDVAYLLAVGAPDRESCNDKIPAKMGNGTGTCLKEGLKVYFSGRETLKGVLGGIQYPKLWINILPHAGLEWAKDELYKGQRPEVEWEKLQAYCEEFYKDRMGYLIPPYFDRSDSRTKKQAQRYKAKYKKCQVAAESYLDPMFDEAV